MIDTRAELVAALREAAELEHGLMVQYLFPALTMKKRLDEGLTGPQQRAVRAWEATILRVAVEEMGHLGTVCNLLASIGVGPHFGRPNFPQQVGYYPFPFDLVPFSDEALYRMLVFELPRGLPLPPPPEPAPAAFRADRAGGLGPDPLEYTYVGELYQQIRAAFEAIDPATLFVGPTQAQVDNDWSVGLDMHGVTDRDVLVRRAEAVAAIDDIIVDGEGAPAGRASSHYGRFSAVRTEYAGSGLFTAARAVVRNPQTREHPDAGTGTMLTDELGRRTAELFNGTYAVVLSLLEQFFTLGPDTEAQRLALRHGASRLMSVAIRPIAEVLTELPAFGPDSAARAGPPFELYDEVSISPFPEARWTIALENLAAIATEATALGRSVPRLAAIGETIGFVRRSITAVAP